MYQFAAVCSSQQISTAKLLVFFLKFKIKKRRRVRNLTTELTTILDLKVTKNENAENFSADSWLVL